MSTRLVIVFSLGLNLLLVAAHLQLPRSEGRPAPPTPAVPAPPSIVAPTPTAEPVTVVHQETEPFHWEDVAHEDFFTYRDNLRAVGCPDRTVRDILVAEVNRTYLRRIEALLQSLNGQFWALAAEAAYDEDALEDQFEPLIESLGDLEKGHRELLRQLLEQASTAPDRPPYTFSAQQQTLVDFLPPEKQQLYAELQLQFATEYQSRNREAQAEGKNLTREQRDALRERKEAALQTLMSPAEYFEYELRNSSLARLRDLQGTSLTQEELRDVAALRLQVQQETPSPPEGSIDDVTRRLLMERYGIAPDPAVAKENPSSTAENSIRERIGEDAYAQLKRAESPGYRELWLLGQRTGLPTTTVNRLLDVQQVARQHTQDVQNQSDWTPDERVAAIEAIRFETENTLRDTLPPEDFDNYSYAIGRWWDDL